MPFKVDEMTVEQFFARLKVEMAELVKRSNIHRTNHSPSCFKYCRQKWKPGQPKKLVCRFRYPRRLVWRSHINSQSQVRLRRLHRWVTPFNPIVTACGRCNTDIRFLLSGPDAKSVQYYVTDYITKMFQTSTQCYTLLHLSLQKLEQSEKKRRIRPADRPQSMITRCLNTQISQKELSQAEALLACMGLPDHYAFHSFVPLYLANFIKVVNHAFVTNKGFTVDPPVATTVSSDGVQLVRMVSFPGTV